ncbi:transglycosylase SLT domain-containing protein [Caballeronia sp. NCTM5]|uniref:lytic transglycosylase domain-containing protein n=1 Tax=Caballeronia sp. NCTM5 TaxID=2921755 RepID=UPI0020282938|nr:transglycosylase SLT domain-containing protein [Caballeronia sp. NCTM5]
MNEEVIKEFLVSIGYKTDETSLRKFTLSLQSVTKTVLKLGTAVVATAAAVVAGVKIISGEMERLYYASQRTGETVGNIMALRYAAGQIGLTADQAQASLEGFTRTLRLNPGMNGLLQQLGVTGNGPLEQFESFIGKMKEMQPYIAAQYAGLFGIDPDTLLMLENGLPKLQAAQAEYQQKLGAFHLNPERAAQAGMSFDNSIRSLTNDIHMFWVLLQEHLAPVLAQISTEFEKWAAGHADETARKIATALEAVAKWVRDIDWQKVGKDVDVFLDKAMKVAQAIGNIVEPFARLANWFGGSNQSTDQAAQGDTPPDADPNDSPFLAWVRRKRWAFQKWVGAVPDTSTHPELSPGESVESETAGKSVNTSALFSRLEKSFGLPAGALDKVWEIESRRGDPKWMLSSAGAKGHFQFTDDTAAQYGVTNPYDLVQSATGAANYLRDLSAKYKGDLRKALAAYNWGPGNLDKDIARNGNAWEGFLPWETQNYLKKFDAAKIGAGSAQASAGSVTISQKTDVHVHGSPDPSGTGRAVAGEQARVNADLVRNMTGAYV